MNPRCISGVLGIRSKPRNRALAIGLLVAFAAQGCASSSEPNTSATTKAPTSTSSKRPTSPFYLNQRIGLGVVQLEVVSATTKDARTTVLVDLYNRDTVPLTLENVAALFRARSQLFGADIEPQSATVAKENIPVDGSTRIELQFVIPVVSNEFPVVMFNGGLVKASDATVWLTAFDPKANE